jgi:hypothetical protein
MHKKIWVIVLVAGIAAPAAAQKADLNGTWKLNVSKSFMGGDHPFSDYQLTKKIVLKDGSISITSISVNASVVNIPLPDSTTRMTVALDAKEHTVQMPPGFPGAPPMTVHVSGSWQGCTLELQEINSGLADYGKERLFLSENGSELIDLIERHATFGDTEQRLVFDKAQ